MNGSLVYRRLRPLAALAERSPRFIVLLWHSPGPILQALAQSDHLPANAGQQRVGAMPAR